MIYIGTDQGIYRWFRGMSWPIFHSLRDRGIVGLDSPGGGVLGVLDDLGRVLESTNNGLDWNEVPTPEELGHPTALALAGTPPRLILATARPMALHTRTIGLPVEERAKAGGPLARVRRWTSGFFGAGEVADVATLRASPGWLPLSVPVVPEGEVPTEIRALAIGKKSGDPWFAAIAGAGLWRSLDDGRSWSRCEGLPSEVFAIQSPEFAEGLVAIGTDNGVWISQDSGDSWNNRSVGLENSRRVRSIAIKPGDPQVLLAGAAPLNPASGGPIPSRGGLSLFALFESKDGGQSWSHVTRGFPDLLEYDQIADIRHDPADPSAAIVALTSGELWHTQTDGLWWEPLARQIKTARVLCGVP